MGRFFLMLLVCFVYGQVLASVEAFRAGVAGFVEERTGQDGYTREQLQAVLGQAKYRQDIIDAMTRPAEGKPWYEYRKIFLTTDRIRKGVRFWADNAELLARAEAEYGVPPEIIVAIIGVETRYGGYMGSHRVIDALSTLAFAYPKRAAFFRGELEEYLRLVREQPIEPTGAKGSYAGAMGKPQFIPSSYRKYAVDFDGDGNIDLFKNNADIIGSVAAYFASFGWTSGGAVAVPVSKVGEGHHAYLGDDFEPAFTLAQLKSAGVEVIAVAGDQDPAQLLSLEQPDARELWVTFHNFYVITRYNHSNLYAMAVYQLSREIRAARQENMAAGS